MRTHQTVVNQLRELAAAADGEPNDYGFEFHCVCTSLGTKADYYASSSWLNWCAQGETISIERDPILTPEDRYLSFRELRDRFRQARAKIIAEYEVLKNRNKPDPNREYAIFQGWL